MTTPLYHLSIETLLAILISVVTGGFLAVGYFLYTIETVLYRRLK
jgi:hypothetical protein